MRRLTMLTSAVITIAALATAAAWQPTPSLGKLRLVDEFARDRNLGAMRDELLTVARRRDVAGLTALSADRLSIGDESMTRDQFLAWVRRMPSEEQDMFWQRLRDALVLGAARVRGAAAGEATVQAPYVPELLSRRHDNGQPLLAIAGTGVAVHRGPSARSAVIDRLDYDVIDGSSAFLDARPTKPGEFDGAYEWLRVTTPGGRRGWVLSKYALTASEPRFLFRNVGGVWKLAGYVTGD